MTDVTLLLKQLDGGDSSAAEKLLPLVYDELRRLAASRLGREKPGDTLQPTALVHEAYLRLVGSPLADGPASQSGAESTGPSERVWNGRGHFFGAAAEAMRRILVEKARYRCRIRHGGELSRIPLTDVEPSGAEEDEQLLDLNEALDLLAAEEPVVAQIVKLRYFAGLTTEQAAEATGVSVRTANRHWAFAKAWLLNKLR